MTKCVVIGAGPGGMNAALYLKRAGIDTIIIEKDVPGGEMLKTNAIENYLGFENISGGELALKMSKQIKDLGIKIIRDKVIKVTFSDKFKVECLNSNYDCDYVIVATGRVPRKLGVRGEDKLTGKGVSYCAICDGAFYRGKEVCVIGGGDSALTEALYLSELCLKVYVIVRRELSASEDLKAKVKKRDNIVILKNVSVSELEYENSLSKVILSDGQSLAVDGMFVAIGGTPNFDFLDGFDIKTINGYIVTNDKMESNIKGLYAVGDVRYKDYYQIITAVCDGAVAALSIKEDL